MDKSFPFVSKIVNHIDDTVLDVWIPQQKKHPMYRRK